MFGKISSINHSEFSHHKNYCYHNCGLCKTLGSEYGITSRLLVNKDIVFLDEMLGMVSAFYGIKTEDSFYSYNCFQMPKGDLPFHFLYSAAITMLLTKHKLADDIEDNRGTKKLIPFIAKNYFKSNFVQAEKYLESIGFPMKEFYVHISNAKLAEKLFKNENNTIDRLAENYGKLCSIVAHHGVKLIRRDTFSTYLSKDIDDFACAFGKIIYICDAYMDIDSDVRNGLFNPLAEKYNIRKNQYFSDDQVSDIKNYINYQYEIINKIVLNSEINPRHMADRIKFNIDRIFAQPRNNNYLHSGIKNIRNKCNAYRTQVNYYSLPLKYKKLPIADLIKRKSSIVFFSAFTVFILGCYKSDVPVGNRVEINPIFLGKWTICDNPEDNYNLEVLKLNNYAYLALTLQKNGEMIKEIMYLSKIKDQYFISSEKITENGKTFYEIYNVVFKNDLIEFNIFDQEKFKKGDGSWLEFQDSEALAKYIEIVMDGSDFYTLIDGKKQGIKFCRK